MPDTTQEPTVADVVKAYLACRRKKEDMQRRHKEELRPINERMQRAETWLLSKLLADGMKHVAAPSGTAYVAERNSCSVEDWEAFFEFLKSGENWHMLTHAANKTAVAQHLAEHGELPPGVKWRSENVVQVRANSK